MDETSPFGSDSDVPPTDASVKTVRHATPDYETLRPYFLRVPAAKVKATFEHTTQFAVGIVQGKTIRHHIKSPFPAHNVLRRNEPVASDTISAGTPAINGGQTMAQFYCGPKSLVIDIFGMVTEKESSTPFSMSSAKGERWTSS